MDVLKVNEVQLLHYCRESADKHHVGEYDLLWAEVASPIYRRGESFYMGIRFDRPFEPEKDAIRIKLDFGDSPKVPHGTRAVMRVLPEKKEFPKDAFKWGAILNETNGQDIVVEIKPPPNAPVGIWKCVIVTSLIDVAGKREEFAVPDDIYLLFNPWCQDDDVYMENDEEREEYVMNETGKIWCGTFKNPEGKMWIFGQFDEISLPAAVFLLEKSRLAAARRGSPIMVSRAISAVINSVDDEGLLEGRWDGDYSDGTSPFAWTGSLAILDQYLNSGGQPVKYGQCWVFSAATVTVCRALGLPCRSTTNYVSAHDTNQTLTVDKYFDIFGNKIEEKQADSCWNFHVWNDVWMARPDLRDAFYNGWQVIDATPQEASDSVMCCGPASAAAVKRGETGFLYDTPFVFSEVNADIIHYQEDQEADTEWRLLSINPKHVGRKIVTKMPGPTDDTTDLSDMMDITSLFKNKEGTEDERLSFYNARRSAPMSPELYDDAMPKGAEDVSFQLVDIDSVPFGDDFEVVLKVHNEASETRTIKAVLSASSILYNGGSAKDIKKSRGTFTLDAGKGNIVSLKVPAEDYIEKLVDHGLVKIYAIANVEETKQIWSGEDDFNMTMPAVSINVAGDCKVGEGCEVEFKFTNPLPVPLIQCSYTVEGPGLAKPTTKPFRDVEPHEEVTIQEIFTAKKRGTRKVVCNFTSKQIRNISGGTKVVVE
ncbi:unnamed protein product [Callosobruchus maculatus]|nr:unnamed protein product [Callosobruchus maculatus]